MKIAFDTGPLGSQHAVRGIGVHTGELVSAIEQESRSKKDFEFKGFDFINHKSEIYNQKFDLVHYTSFHPHFITLPLLKPAKKVILTIHDLIRLIYPKAYPAGLKGNIRFQIQKLLLEKNVDTVVTISETSKKDIVRFLPFREENIFVTYLAQKKSFRKLDAGSWKSEIKNKFGLPEKFVLYVGDVNYNKNLLTLGKACEIAKIPLVMVGKKTISEGMDFTHPENHFFGEFLKKYGSSRNVLRLGFVEDSDLVKIWNLASVYCFPSLYEGFSITPLDSMACGVPVVASRINVHKEICEDAVLYADPKGPKEFAEKILKLINNESLRNEMVKKGLEQIKKFSWEKCAKETIRIYDQVLKRI